MGTPQVPFDPTGSPFPKQPPSSGERPEPKGDDGPLPEKDEEELS